MLLQTVWDYATIILASQWVSLTVSMYTTSIHEECSVSTLTILPAVSLDHSHCTIPFWGRINLLRAAHFASSTRFNMFCFPSYNDIGFQLQILKKAGTSLHPADHSQSGCAPAFLGLLVLNRIIC